MIPLNQFASAAAQDLMRTPGSTVKDAVDPTAELLKKKKVKGEPDPNAVIQSLPTFFGAVSSLMNKNGNQF